MILTGEGVVRSSEAHFVLLIPVFASSDLAWIQDWRRKHDAKLADEIAPHFTLVFAVPGWNDEEMVREVAAQVAGIEPFSISLDAACAHQDPISGMTLDFLLPG